MDNHPKAGACPIKSGQKKRLSLKQGTKLGAGAIFALVAIFLWSSGSWYVAKDRLYMATRYLNFAYYYSNGKALPGTPDLARLDDRLKEKGLKRGDPVFIRIFKNELSLELWMKRDGAFVHFATYPICYWSGRLGPKLRQGDHQAPEGFYTVSKGQLNPASRWHRSFNLGFPNLLDRVHRRTGAHLMVHGGCSSIGCYAMTNPVIDEMWQLITAAMNGGQDSFAVHVFPFPLTEARLKAYGDNQWASFWRELKPGFDLFEANHIPPEVSVCGARYVVEPGTATARDAAPLRAACPKAAQQS